MQHVNIVVVQ